VIRVRQPGLLTTVQDGGRRGQAHLGVPAAGAADRRALGLANRLAGNAPDAAALEVTLAGPELEFGASAWVALTGGAAADLDGRPVAMDVAVWVRAGQVLRVGAVTGGLRAYLAVRGGIEVAPVLGSRSTDTLARLGPPQLKAGDTFGIGGLADRPPYVEVAPSPPVGAEPVLRAVRGPRDDYFTEAALRTLTRESYEVTSDSDRTGLRLDGPPLERRRTEELKSEGMVEGALQVPPDGKPILFLANHPTTGGYPVVAVVASADLPLAAQARPGSRLRFRLVPVREARAASR
jgi:biotin-dependent carboxylase-like uncharacterized protein